MDSDEELYQEILAGSYIAWDKLAKKLNVPYAGRGFDITIGKERIGLDRPVGPSRYASSRCKSYTAKNEAEAEQGKRCYCTCDICW